VKVKVGTTVTNVEVRYTLLTTWVQTDWVGGSGQTTWSDPTRYASGSGVDDTVAGEVRLSVASGNTVMFSDDFTRPPVPTPMPFTWIIPSTGPTYPNHGVFNTNSGILNSGLDDTLGFYGYAYTNTVTINDHSVEADIRFPNANSYGGGIFGRLNATNGQRYSAWINPEGSGGVPNGYGPAVVKLIKYYDWGSWGAPTGLATVSIPSVSTVWHHLKMTFSGNRIQVFYDNSPTPAIEVIDTAPYTSGYVGVDLWNTSYTSGPTYNNFVARDNTNAIVLSDDFGTDWIDPLLPWTRQQGTWTVANSVLQGTTAPSESYAFVYYNAGWTDYTEEGRIQFPAGAFGGGISGRVNPATGARYSAWVYPDGSSGGSNVLKLIKFSNWTTWALMQQVSLPSVGTGWHTLKTVFNGSRIRVYYDDTQVIDVTDSVDMATDLTSYVMSADDIIVRSLPQYGNSGTLLSSAFDGGTGVEWKNISWDAAGNGNTSVRMRTRTADTSSQLSTAPWSGYYTASGSQITSGNSRWIQYEVQLTSSDPSITAILNEIRITYLPPSKPTAVTLSSFTARAASSSELCSSTLAWTTASEVNTAGFNVYRSERPDGPYTRINAQLIPASGETLLGSKYHYEDTSVIPGQTYYYQLEDVAFDGASVRHQPLAVSVPSALGLSVNLELLLGIGMTGLLLIGTGVYCVRRRPKD
jgi:hypothetical protein